MGDKRKKGTDGESAQPTRHRSGKAPGKKTLVDKHYAPPRGRKPAEAEAENAHMSVKASESPEAGAPLASWEGKTFFHVGEGEEPLAHYTAHKERGKWQWSDPAGATLKVDSDAKGKSGQPLAEWAPDQARYMEADIEPLAGSGGRAPDVLHGHGPIEFEPELITLEEAERLTAGLDPSTRAAALMFVDSPATDAIGGATEAGDGSSADAQGDKGAGSADRGHGKGDASRAGRRKARTDEHGSEEPSWYFTAGAEIARNGGRTPIRDGKRGGSAGGDRGGTGNILGSGLLNVIDSPEQVAPLVNAGIVLVEANVAEFGRGLFKRVLGGMTREAIEREIAREAKEVIAAELRKETRRLQKLEAFRKAPRAEQDRLLQEAERKIEREYHERLEKFARREAEEQEAVVARLADAGDAKSAHNRKVAAENAAAYRQIEDAAAKKTGGTVAVRPDDAVAARPYDAHTTRAELEAEYPGQVTSSTVPPTSQPNVKLRGQRHPKTAVAYDQRGFPTYDDVAVYDMRLPRAAWSESDNRILHMRAATKELAQAVEEGKISAGRFTPRQLEAIRSGDAKIPGYTWHHHQDPGRMQLVPETKHQRSGHVGGMNMWFEGSK